MVIPIFIKQTQVSLYRHAQLVKYIWFQIQTEAKGVPANEIHYQDGVVYLCEHNTKIKIIDVRKKLSCPALKNKQDCVDRCKEVNTQGSLATLKSSLICHFEKKTIVTGYETKVFQLDTVNIFGSPKFTSICFPEKI